MDAPISRVNRSKEAARASYNRLSRWYDAVAGSTEKKYRDMGLEKLSAQPGEKILEIGFGTGHCLVSLAKAVGPTGCMIGVDISDGMLAIARERLQGEGLNDRVELHQGDAAKLDFLEAGSLDGVFMSFTLELFDNPEIPRVLEECHRILKPGGRLSVVSMTKTNPPGVAVRMYEWFHEHMPNYADCRPIFARQAIEQGGFTIQDISVSSMWGLPVEIVLEEIVKIIYIATGAANMYCGSCMHDNALAAGMKAAGEDVSLFPLYTPMRLDEENVGEQIFYGGIKAYLMQKYPRPFFGRDLLLRVAGSQGILRLMPRFDIGSAVDPVANAELTISMLKGEDGNQRELLQELVQWIKLTYRPDVVHVTNALLIGVVREFKRSLQIPITCGLHGEDIFLEGMPQPYQDEALEIIRERAHDVDRFLAISTYYSDMFSKWVGLDRSRIDVVWPGIALSDYRDMSSESTTPRPLTIGFLARFVPEKGLHLLVDAFIRLYRSGEFPDLRLVAGGYVSRAYKTYIDGIRKTIKDHGLEDRIKLLGTLERSDKLKFFQQIDVFSVPAPYREPKGISILEALASGVPVVQPDHGAYPEWVNATQGGLLHRPHDSVDLAEKLATLLRDADLRKRLGRHGRQGIFEKFSSERMASATIDVLRNLMQNRVSA